MAYELIETVEVGAGGAASIEFTSIPQDGVDLLLKLSLRTSTTGSTITEIQFNNDTATNYNWLRLFGDGSTVSTFLNTSLNRGLAGMNSTSGFTANTFNNADCYMANYTSTTNKSFSVEAVSENNATESYQFLSAQSYTTSSAITSIKLYNSATWVQYSTASLYKIS